MNFNKAVFSSCCFNPPMAKGGWIPPNRFFLIFLRNGKSFRGKPKFLPVGSSLGHLSMKNFSDQTYCLGSKIRQRKICLSQAIGFFHKNYTLAYFALFFWNRRLVWPKQRVFSELLSPLVVSRLFQ